jgi:hypothetical protein
MFFFGLRAPMKDLPLYLNDHLAGSIGALKFIAHSAQ